MAQRGAFTIREVEEGRTIEDGWNILREPAEPRVLRAFVDQTTMMWVLKKKVGDRITYQDERGEDFEVEISGALADSIFQGNMIVDEAAFLRQLCTENPEFGRALSDFQCSLSMG